MFGSRPAETWQAIVALLVAAGLEVYGFAIDEVKSLVPQISGLIVGLLGFIATAVTAWIASKQRDPASSITSAPDGRVVT